MMWDGDHMSGWGYGLMGLSNLLIWFALIAGAVAVFRYLARTGSHPDRTGTTSQHRSSPEELLAERYARGEIDDDEYHRRLATLRTGTGTGTGRPG